MRVFDVVDGDTVKIRTDGSARETVRLIGLDTPETRKPGGCPVRRQGPLPPRCSRRRSSSPVDSDADADGLADHEGGRGVLVGVQTDRNQDLRDGFGRRLSYVDAEDDLPLLTGSATTSAGPRCC